MFQFAEHLAYRNRENLIHILCSRISIEKIREVLDKAEKSGEKHTTLARLLEENYK